MWKKLLTTIAVCAMLGHAGVCAPPAPLANSGFEQTDATAPERAASWSDYGSGYKLDTTHRSGTRSLRCDNLEGGKTSGAFVTYTLNQSRPVPIQVSGWSKAQDVDGVSDNDYSVYVDVVYSDGSSLYGQTAPFETDTHDWQRGQVTNFPGKPVRSVNVYALFRNHTGTVWFDDFAVREITSDRL
ncbi:MAG: hypothetical protein H7Y38_08265, partial [Armatimonadetes bacterium]|nr:hypothetical protein [Armatimonadota bacterium]